MKKTIFFALIACISLTTYSQYRWEASAGGTFSKISFDNTETTGGVGFYVNAGYGYVSGFRAKTSFVFSLDLVQRNSEIAGLGDVSALQVGFNPKFRFLFNRGKDRFRPFVNVGPSIRLNTSFEVGGIKLDTDSYEQLIIGGVYGAGFSQMIGEMFDIMMEVGVMNDFTNNLKNEAGEGSTAMVFDTGSSKFFDIYARIGVRFRIYDARR